MITIILATILGLGLNNSVIAQSLLFMDNFDYPAGDNLTSHGWVGHNGTGNLNVGTPGLTLDDYAGSGIGNMAAVDSTGIDVHHTFAAQTTGTLYVSFLFNTNGNASAGYFFHLGMDVISTTYFGRTYVNATGTGIAIGAGTTVPTVFVPVTPGTTYLAVIKYDLATKLNQLLIVDTLPLTEPGTYSQSVTETMTYTNIGSVALRQYNSAQRIYVDGIRVGTTWADVVTSAPIATFNPANGATNVPIASNITITFDEKVRNIDNSAITTPSSLIVLKETDALGAAVPFTATLDATNKIFTIDPVSDLTNFQQYYVAISPVEDSINYATTLQEATFTTISSDVTPPTVVSATATSLSNILVVFNEPVNATAEVTANYTGVGAITSATRTTTQDSVNIVLTTPLTFGVPDTICLQNIADIVGNTMLAQECYQVQYGVLDVTPPVVDTAWATGLSTVKITFNEVVDNVTAENIANYTGLPGIATAVLSTSMDTVTLTLSSPLTFGVPDTLIVNNVADTAGNPMTVAQSLPVVYGVLDVTPPTALNAWAQTLSTVKVKFSESMDATSAQATANYTGLAGIGTATLSTSKDTVTLALSTPLLNGVPDTLYVQNVLDSAGNAMAAQQMFVLFLDTATGPKNLVITEIMYNSPESGVDSLEFIEIYNNDVTTVNMAGYVLTYGSSNFTFPAGLFVNPGAYILVAPQATKATNFYGVPFMQGATGGISNSGTTVKIKSPTAVLIDSVVYLPGAPWPTDANANGYSLSLCNPDLDNNVAGNWSLGHNAYGVVNSKTVYADPGQGCVSSNDSIAPMATHAWLTNFTTVKVRYNEAVEALSAEDGTNYTGLGTISNAILNTTLDTVTLTLATPMVSGVADSLFITNISDTSGNVMTQVYAFRLMLDTTSTVMDLVISEIMYNSPESGIDSLEFIEIYNNDAVAVDLLNYKISYGSVFKVFDASFVINPGGYAIIAPNKAAADAFYGISSIQGPTTGITNSGTFVKLNSPSGLLVDSLTYGTTAPWPTDAAGLGRSITLCDVDVDNTDGANWSGSTRFVGIIGGINVYADPDTTCTTISISENELTEINVFPNPANDVINITGVANAASIEVYSNMGMLVFSRQAEGSDLISVNASDLTNGLYYIRIRLNDGAVETRPVVIIR